MAGLNDIISNTAVQTTTLPSWYDTASQNIATGASNIASTAPTPSATVGQKAVDLLGGAGPTPFQTAAGTTQQIASGAANPWIVSDTGQVTPNVNTPMGGLFQAQNQQLRQLIPSLTAAPNANAIGSGQFGSLRGQTAAAKAVADAEANLFANQMQSALSNQQTGVQAALGSGTLTNQDINALLTTGQYQQASPYTNLANYANIINTLQTPTTVSNTTQLSPLNQIAGLIAALGGQSGQTGILGSLGVSGGLGGLISKAGDWLKGVGTTDTSGTTGNISYPIDGGYTTSGGTTINPGDYAQTPTGEGIY